MINAIDFNEETTISTNNEELEQLLAQREKYQATLDKVIANDSDNRVIGSWRARVAGVDHQIEVARAAMEDFGDEFSDDSDDFQGFLHGSNNGNGSGYSAAIPPADETNDATPVAHQPETATEPTATATVPAPTPKAKTKRVKKGGTLYCLCGCGKSNNPGSRFQMGHDARLKSALNKVQQGFESGTFIPTVAVEEARRNPDMTVASFTAQEILQLSELVVQLD